MSNVALEIQWAISTFAPASLSVIWPASRSLSYNTWRWGHIEVMCIRLTSSAFWKNIGRNAFKFCCEKAGFETFRWKKVYCVKIFKAHFRHRSTNLSFVYISLSRKHSLPNQPCNQSTWLPWLLIYCAPVQDIRHSDWIHSYKSLVKLAYNSILRANEWNKRLDTHRTNTLDTKTLAVLLYPFLGLFRWSCWIEKRLDLISPPSWKRRSRKVVQRWTSDDA